MLSVGAEEEEEEEEVVGAENDEGGRRHLSRAASRKSRTPSREGIGSTAFLELTKLASYTSAGQRLTLMGNMITNLFKSFFHLLLLDLIVEEGL